MDRLAETGKIANSIGFGIAERFISNTQLYVTQVTDFLTKSSDIPVGNKLAHTGTGKGNRLKQYLPPLI